MGAQASCTKSAESCADKCVDKFRAVETVLHTAENSNYDDSKKMLHESLLNQELLRAAMEGRPKLAAVQLERGAFIETRRPFTIVFEGDLESKRSQANLGLTPLMHAALGGHAETCAVLVTAGAQVNAEDEDRMRPLHFAAKAGSLDVFQLLLRARADASCKDADGLTPLAQLAPWCKTAKADFQALLTTDTRSLLPAPTAAATAEEAAEASTAAEAELEISATVTCETPESQFLHVSEQEPREAMLDKQACALSHAPEAILAVLDTTSSDGTAIPEGLLQEPSWMVRELTLLPTELTLPAVDSACIVGEGEDEVSSLQDGLAEVDESNWMVREQTLLPADSVNMAGEGDDEANSLQDGLTEEDESTWMVRELTLLPGDSVNMAGEGDSETSSLQDRWPEADEFYDQANIEIPKATQRQPENGESLELLPL